MKRCYVKSVAQISCQEPLSEKWKVSPLPITDYYTPSIEPDMRDLISPGVSRRMGKILRRAVATSFTALKAAGIETPGGIITATGVGCMENSEKFLTDLVEYGEECLKPTLFMQSTHNTISSQIAILLNCHGYNNTFSHKGSSFASSLLDGLLKIENSSLENVLVGSFDEVTPFMADIMRKTHPEFDKVTEGAFSTVLSSEGKNSLCVIEDVAVIRRPHIEDIEEIIRDNKDGMFYLGVNGNQLNDSNYSEIIDKIGDKNKIGYYHNIFGDGFSAAAFGFYAAVTHLAGSQETERITILDFSDDILSIIRIKKTEEGEDD